VFTRYIIDPERAALFTVGVDGIGLATMNPDGTDRHFISSNPEEMHQPDWESVP
jgi:hypothetical protein